MKVRTNAADVNELLQILNNYINDNISKIKTNEKNRRCDVLGLAQLIYIAAGFNVCFSNVFSQEQLNNPSDNKQWFPLIPGSSSIRLEWSNLAVNLSRSLQCIEVSALKYVHKYFNRSQLRYQFTICLENILVRKKNENAFITECSKQNSEGFKLTAVPGDVLFIIQKNLNLHDLLSLIKSCKKFSELTWNEDIWRFRARTMLKQEKIIISDKSRTPYRDLFFKKPSNDNINVCMSIPGLEVKAPQEGRSLNRP